MRLSLNLVWDLIIKWCLYLAIFLSPLFFLPWTLYIVSLNKQTLLFTLISLALIAWLIRGISRGEVICPRTVLKWLVGGLLLLSLLSLWFSGARSLGFWGFSGAEVDTFISLLALAGLLGLAASELAENRELNFTLKLFTWSALIVSIFSLLQLWGFWTLPWLFTQDSSFNPIGTSNALALYLGFVFILSSAALYLGRQDFSLLFRTALGIAVLLSFLMVLALGYWPVFIGWIAVGLLAVAADLRSRPGEVSKRMFLPLALIVVAAFFLLTNLGFFNFPLPGFNLLPEVTPSLGASWQIAKSTLQESLKNFLLGSGPATYQYQYGLYRDPTLNQTLFWDIRFNQGYNALLTQLVQGGVLGFLLLLGFLGTAALLAIRLLLKRGLPAPVYAFTLAVVYLALMMFFYPQNFVLYFLLFALTGLLLGARAEITEDYQRWSLSDSPAKTLIYSLVMMLLIMVMASLLYLNSQRYWGAVRFAQGVVLANTSGDVEKALPALLAGRDLDPRNDFYLRVAAETFLLRASNLLTDTTKQLPTSDLQVQFSGNVGAAIQLAQRATEVNPRHVANWLTLARIYENLIGLVDGSASAAFAAYNQAAKLEPNNPVISANLGRAHLANQDYQAAIDNLEKAINLKPDYAPAHFSLVQVFDRQNKNEEAVARAERLRSLAPNDVGLLFQLGLLHYQAERFNKAREVFENIAQLTPDYANALYFLGLIYDRQNQRELAIKIFKHIADLNPDNQEVRQILRNLRRGDPALKDISQPAPEERTRAPIEEKEKDSVIIKE